MINQCIIVSIVLLVILVIFNYLIKNRIKNKKVAVIVEGALYFGLLFILIFRWINK